ncbi:MAG: HepT-like ribonuclease domain-containing protein [Parvularculaceae bacterium]
MPRKAQALLRDILEAADDIVDFIGDRDFETYLRDKVVRFAVERKFEIIGEATKLLSEEAPEVAERIRQRATLIAFRNVLIHGYSRVDDKRVYLAAKAPLTELRQNVESLLAELDKR